MPEEETKEIAYPALYHSYHPYHAYPYYHGSFYPYHSLYHNAFYHYHGSLCHNVEGKPVPCAQL